MNCSNVDSNMVSHPYSFYVWQPPRSPRDEGHWSEPAQCFTEQWAIYIANLMHQESHAVMKVMRYGINLPCLPDEHAVELVEKQMAQEWKRRREDEE